MVMMYTTVESTDDAQDLAKKVVESKLASCVNILAAHTSMYLEGGTLKTTEEIGLLIKIPEDHYAFAYEAIKAWHPYQIPAMLSWPAEANKAYSVWAYQQTRAIM
jgi:periplasmic divalent cation tolerance protein